MNADTQISSPKEFLELIKLCVCLFVWSISIYHNEAPSLTESAESQNQCIKVCSTPAAGCNHRRPGPAQGRCSLPAHHDWRWD